MRRCVLTTDTSSVATVLSSDVSIAIGDGWSRCILCCPLLPITKAGCWMMEERTSSPLL